MNNETIKAILSDPVNGRLVLSASLANFIKFFHWYLYRQEFILKPFHIEVIRKIEDIAFGRTKKRNLVINFAPRLGKSSVCKYACGWSYMLNPRSNCIYTSYNDDLASDFSKEIREILESEAFRTLTGLGFKKGKTGADYWVTTGGGGFRAAPLGGGLTGYGFGVSSDEFGGFGIIDDPQKPSLVKSQTELQNTIDLYENAFKSRANNRAKSPIIMIMQRVAIDDLAGYVLENEAEDWDLVKVPALNEETGESVWEEKLPAAELLKLKKQNPFVYYSQYQQEPIVIGGSVIKTEWFRYYNTSDTFIYQSSWFTADTAQKKGEANDFTVFQYWAKTYDNRLHLIDMVRGKFDAPELREQIIMFWEKWKGGINGCTPYGFYIEDKSSGIGAIQEIRKTYPLPIIPITRARYKDGNMIVKQDKFSRVMTIVPYIANGWVYLPNSEKDDMSSLLLSECAAFKADLTHKHDDMCFTAGTPIATIFGDKPIEKIKAGDYVITPLGIRKVLDSRCTGYKKTINKFGIRATSNHKFFTWKGFKPFESVNDLSECDVFSLKGLITWRYKKLLSLMVSNIDLWEGRKGIISLSQQKIQGESILKDFMLQFGNFIREKKFLKGMLFTTKTIILIIMSFLIWSAYHAGNILGFMKMSVLNGAEALREKSILKKLGNLLKRGIKQKNQKNLNEKTLKLTLTESEKQKSALIVEESFPPVESLRFVKDVEMPIIIEKDGQKKEKVYNLTIDRDNVYYANRVLVSNCDAMADAVDIAFGATGISSIFI